MARREMSTLPWSARGGRKAPKAENQSIHALHAFFKRITDAAGSNAPVDLLKVVKRLATSNRNRAPMKISAIADAVAGTGKTAMVVTKVLDDERLLTLPALNIVALRWSHSVQRKIEANGGTIAPLDAFMKVAGSLENIVLLKGDPDARKATKFFGPAPGERGSSTYPRTIGKCREGEKRINHRKPIVFEDDSE